MNSRKIRWTSRSVFMTGLLFPLSYLGNVYLIKYNKTKLIMIITALSVLTLFIIFNWNLPAFP